MASVMGMHYRLNMVADIGHFPPLTRSRKAKRAHLGAFRVFREMAELAVLLNSRLSLRMIAAILKRDQY